MPVDPRIESQRAMLQAVEQRARRILRRDGYALKPGWVEPENALGGDANAFAAFDNAFGVGYDSGLGVNVYPFFSDFSVVPFHIGTAQAGTASTITLAASASAVDDEYNGEFITITGGTGGGQSRVIDDYVGATKVATVTTDWTVNPDNTSTYVVGGGGEVVLG